MGSSATSQANVLTPARASPSPSPQIGINTNYGDVSSAAQLRVRGDDLAGAGAFLRQNARGNVHAIGD